MTADTSHYGKVENRHDLREVFEAVRRDVSQARSRRMLTELYRRAGYLIALTHTPSWQAKFGAEAQALREVGQDEFRKTAQKINQQAKHIGAEPDYDEEWGA